MSSSAVKPLTCNGRCGQAVTKVHRLLGISSKLLLWKSQKLTQHTRAQQVPFRQVLRPARRGTCDLTIFVLLSQPLGICHARNRRLLLFQHAPYRDAPDIYA